MSLHQTKGPWRARGTLGPASAQHLKGPHVVEDSEGKQVAVVSGFGCDETMSIARVMAASPDLLNVLQVAVFLYENYGLVAGDPVDEITGGQWVNKARAAILKATGEQQ